MQLTRCRRGGHRRLAVAAKGPQCMFRPSSSSIELHEIPAIMTLPALGLCAWHSKFTSLVPPAGCLGRPTARRNTTSGRYRDCRATTHPRANAEAGARVLRSAGTKPLSQPGTLATRLTAVLQAIALGVSECWSPLPSRSHVACCPRIGACSHTERTGSRHATATCANLACTPVARCHRSLSRASVVAEA